MYQESVFYLVSETQSTRTTGSNIYSKEPFLGLQRFKMRFLPQKVPLKLLKTVISMNY